MNKKHSKRFFEKVDLYYYEPEDVEKCWHKGRCITVKFKNRKSAKVCIDCMIKFSLEVNRDRNSLESLIRKQSSESLPKIERMLTMLLNNQEKMELFKEMKEKE